MISHICSCVVNINQALTYVPNGDADLQLFDQCLYDNVRCMCDQLI